MTNEKMYTHYIYGSDGWCCYGFANGNGYNDYKLNVITFKPEQCDGYIIPLRWESEMNICQQMFHVQYCTRDTQINITDILKACCFAVICLF